MAQRVARTSVGPGVAPQDTVDRVAQCRKVTVCAGAVRPSATRTDPQNDGHVGLTRSLGLGVPFRCNLPG